MYDPELMKRVWLKFVDEFDSDTFDGTLFFQAQVNDLLEAKRRNGPAMACPMTLIPTSTSKASICRPTSTTSS